ncbi:MAG: sigma-54-dependent Fis family transcriptional regulator [Planctomycetes bacterium]|nr:sigma-54-dependent Fis family transcriptional regulator [Planctomycetota bacterium]MBI3848012.1 sigma-54-dependent Fis family transcriptional regulator [Planctomycetota bacterium]
MSETAILIVDDQKDHALAVQEALERVGFRCVVAASGEAGLRALSNAPIDVVVTDLVMRDVDGMAILRAAREREDPPEVIVVTGHASVESAVAAMREGALTYLKKPFDLDEIRTVVKKAAEQRALARRTRSLEQQLDKKFGFERIIGNTPAMQRIVDVLGQISPTSVTVLILGESGTGKELVAKAIHQNSPRKQHQFVALNCASLSEGVLESELFGHERGAFTGAVQARKGRFEFADKGTLFLDEVGDMPIPTQVKLLRVLEEREILRVGSNVPVAVDVRLIAATNQDLEQLVRQGRFREDLYFRLRVVTIELPPLRDRQADIPLLVDHFLREFAHAHAKKIKGMTAMARMILVDYPWPGNVRELRNCIENMVVVSRGTELDVEDIPTTIVRDAKAAGPATLLSVRPLADVERDLIRAALAESEGNRGRAAVRLGISERTLYRKIKEFGFAGEKGGEAPRPEPRDGAPLTARKRRR